MKKQSMDGMDGMDGTLVPSSTHDSGSQPPLYQHDILHEEAVAAAGNKKREPIRKTWVFTWNNHHLLENWEDCVEALMAKAVQFAAQEEVAPSTGTRHLQGAAVFAKPTRPTEAGLLPSGVWWQMMKKKPREALLYCLKEDTRMAEGRQWQKGCPRVPRPLERVLRSELRPWQERIFALVEKPCPRDDRTIRWYWEPNGNVGKTFLVKCLIDSGLSVVQVAGKAADLMYFVAEYHKANYEGPDIVVIDIPRVNHNGISYSGIEAVKNGLVASTKYECRNVRMNTPHVLVFANEEPEREKLSHDRWVVKELVGLGLP